jgi:uncharacterized protein YlxW (UPF0749 family)
MTEDADSRPAPGSDDLSLRGRGWSAWRVVTPVAVLLCGGLFAVSAHNSGGTDLRPGRYTDLTSLVRTERRQHDALQERATRLKKEVDSLTEAVDNSQVRALRARARTLEAPAGLVEQTGPGLTIVLSDSSDEVAASSPEDPRLLVVHQQDIQAVANALWRGGATAVTIQGQRVVSTTGIKCIGNSVQLQGVPYAQPYTISGVGDPVALAAAVEADAYLQLYRSDAEEPDIAVGWQETVEERVVAPAYDGTLDLSYAKPLRTTG